MKRDSYNSYGMTEMAFGALYTGEGIETSANF
jgi:hypothetical protein